MSEIPVLQQAKLLRFVETLKYNRLGDSKELTGNVRIITATNKDLKQAVIKNSFREDLYFRLSILEILIPPLRDRKEDVLMLFEEKKKLLKNKEISDDSFNIMLTSDTGKETKKMIPHYFGVLTNEKHIYS